MILVYGDVTSLVRAYQDRLSSYKFGNHKHSDSADIVFLVCHRIWKYHVIKGSYGLYAETY